MKILSLATLAALGLAPLQAAVVTDSFDKAKELDPKDGYVLVVYPDGWDSQSATVAKQWLASESLLKAMGDSAVLTVPLPQVSTDETKDKHAQILGPLTLPKASLYPAIFLMDSDGDHYGTVAVPGMRKKKAHELIPHLENCLKAKQQQKALLDKAATLPQGTQKAELLGQAAIIPGINQPKNILNELRAADPEDATGYIRRLTFNPWGLAHHTAKDWTFEESETKLQALLDDPAYSPEQKQKICATYIGLLRRNAAPGSQEKMAQLIDRMRSLNPDDLQGKSADIAARQWLRSFSLSDGWSPAVLPLNDEKPLELAPPIKIEAPGTYELCFRFTSGKMQLNIAAVELYDGDKKVAEDRHPGYTGYYHKNNTYTLKVDAPIAKPRILVYLAMKGERDSAGTISLKKQ